MKAIAIAVLALSSMITVYLIYTTDLKWPVLANYFFIILIVVLLKTKRNNSN